MEAVDLTFPVEVAGAQKFMGIEGLVRAGVTVKELEPCDLDRVSVRASPLTEACSSFLGDKGGFLAFDFVFCFFKII